MSGGTFEKLFGAWAAAEADLYEALDQWPSSPSAAWEDKVRAMKALADQRYAELFGARERETEFVPDSEKLGTLTARTAH